MLELCTIIFKNQTSNNCRTSKNKIITKLCKSRLGNVCFSSQAFKITFRHLSFDIQCFITSNIAHKWQWWKRSSLNVVKTVVTSIKVGYWQDVRHNGGSWSAELIQTSPVKVKRRYSTEKQLYKTIKNKLCSWGKKMAFAQCL